MMSLPNYQFSGLVIAVFMLTSSQADGTHNNHRSLKPAPLATKNCHLTISSHIQDLCQAYYSSDCRGTTTEAQGTSTEAAAQPLYDCKIASNKLVDPLFNSDTATMAQTVMALYASTVKVTSDGKTIDSVLGAMQMLCKRFGMQGYNSCFNKATPDFFDDIRTNPDYFGDCENFFDEEMSSTKKFYEPECMKAQIQQANATCSAFYYNGCLYGSTFNVTCFKNSGLSDSQGSTTETPDKTVYDCTVPLKLVDPFLNSSTAKFVHTVMTMAADEKTTSSVVGALQLLCSRTLHGIAKNHCENPIPHFYDNIGDFQGCKNPYDDQSVKDKWFESAQCPIEQADLTCSALDKSGCIKGSSYDVTCFEKMVIKN